MPKNKIRNIEERVPQVRVDRPSTMDRAVEAQLSSFARFLDAELKKRRWNQAELARRAFGTRSDANGRSVPNGRDRISRYMLGRSLPDQEGLTAIARVLDILPENLLPEVMKSPADRLKPEKAVEFRGNLALLTVNMLCPSALALKILQLLNEASTAENEGKPWADRQAEISSS